MLSKNKFPSPSACFRVSFQVEGSNILGTVCFVVKPNSNFVGHPFFGGQSCDGLPVSGMQNHPNFVRQRKGCRSRILDYFLRRVSQCFRHPVPLDFRPFWTLLPVATLSCHRSAAICELLSPPLLPFCTRFSRDSLWSQFPACEDTDLPFSFTHCFRPEIDHDASLNLPYGQRW